MTRDETFQALLDVAHDRGRLAAELKVPTPMIVTGTGLDGVKHTYPPVMDGVCGFAWVNVSPCTTSFGRWLKRAGIVDRRAYHGGYDLWISDYGQSMERKEAHAQAVAETLREAGIVAYARSRMD
jgi:hypothetical protein